jgi:molybdate transport system substrate-binding protein
MGGIGRTYFMSNRKLAAGVVFGAVLILAQVPAQAADLIVRTSLTFSGALDAVSAGYEKASGDKVHPVSAGGEAPDLLILQKAALDPLIKGGTVDPKSVVDLVTVRIGVAGRSGVPLDVSTNDKFKAALLAAKAVVVSGASSGQYVTKEVFTKLGIADQMKAKTKVIRGSVGDSIAKGEADLGFQQMSELLQTKAIMVKRIPEDLQSVTTVSGAITTGAKSPDAAKKLMAYVKSPAAAAALKTMDMEATK